MSTIDLESPGSLKATAENAKDYTFLILLPDAKYTKDALAANPNMVDGDDLLLKSHAIPDEGGRASFDLASKASDVIQKLEDLEKPSQTQAKVAVVTTAQMDNHDLDKTEADVKDFTLQRKGEELKLKDIRAVCQPQHWVAYHHAIIFVELEVKGDITEVEVSWPTNYPMAERNGRSPMFSSWEQASPGTNEVKELVLGVVGDPHSANKHCSLPAKHHARSWWNGVPGWRNGKVKMPVEGGKRYVLGFYPRGSGMFPVTVKGTGAFGHVKDKIECGMQGKHPRPGD